MNGKVFCTEMNFSMSFVFNLSPCLCDTFSVTSAYVIEQAVQRSLLRVLLEFCSLQQEKKKSEGIEKEKYI